MHLGCAFFFDFVSWFIWIMFLFVFCTFFIIFLLLWSNGKGVYALVQDGVGGSWSHFYSLFYFILFLFYFFSIFFFFYHLIASWTLWPWFISLWSILLSLLIRFQFFTRDIVSRFFGKEAYRMPLKTVFTRKWRNLLSNRTDLIKIWTWYH